MTAIAEIQVRDLGCEVVDVFDDWTAIVRNRSGKYDIRQIGRDSDMDDALYVDRYTEGASDWATEAEAWAYACGYDAGARENM